MMTDDYEPSFQRKNRMLSYISEGLEEDYDDDTSALDESGRSSNNGIRASVFLRGDSILESVPEDDTTLRSWKDGASVSSAHSRGKATVTTAPSSDDSSRRTTLSSSFTSHSKSLRSSMQSTGSSNTHATSTSVNSASSPLIFTPRTQVATREINIHETPYFVMTDESVPQEYSDASVYEHELILPPKKEESIASSEEEADYRLMFVEDKWREKQLLFTSQRKLYALVTIMGAISLSIAGIIFAAQVLSTSSSLTYRPSYNAEYFFLPRYQFGGGSGGIAGIRDDGVRSVEDSQYYGDIFESVYKGASASEVTAVESSSSVPNAPQLVPVGTSNANPNNVNLVANTGARSSSLRSSIPRSAQDPFDGFGPRQFNPMYDSHRPQVKATLTSSAMRSYTLPENDGLIIVLDPAFNGAMMDVSILPVNAERETPVFWDVPMTGVARFQYVMGHCLKLVQCSNAGQDLLLREFEEGGYATEATNGLEALPTNFDPPLKTAYMQSSKFVNVDCSTPQGIDRGISHELSTSNMIDIVYTPNIHDAARLFAPPIQAYGRGVVMMRHPVERVVALYEYSRLRGRTVGSAEVTDMSLEEFSTYGKCDSCT
jgi:hypothetical protein